MSIITDFRSIHSQLRKVNSDLLPRPEAPARPDCMACNDMGWLRIMFTNEHILCSACENPNDRKRP